MESYIDRVKKAFYNGKISDSDLLANVINPTEYLNKIKQVDIIKPRTKEMDNLMLVLEEFFTLLNTHGIYKIDLIRLNKTSKDFIGFTLKYKQIIDLLTQTQKIKKGALKTYLIANVYHSIFEINKHLLSDLIKELANYFKDKTKEVGDSPPHIEEINKKICTILDKREKYGISDFLFLLGLFDKKFNTSFLKQIQIFFDVGLRNLIAHEKVTYNENGLISDSDSSFKSNIEIIDKISLTLIFSTCYLYNKKGFVSVFYDIAKGYDIKGLTDTIVEATRKMIG